MAHTCKVDLHIHTCASRDGVLHPADVISLARGRGLDCICITDHNTLEGALLAQELDPDFVIVGEEILLDVGCEILAFFVREWVPPRLTIEATLDRLEAQGAVISISHPFDRRRNRPWEEEWLAAISTRIDALEGFNARTIHPADNERAVALATRLQLPVTAGSDAHTGREIGAAYLEMPVFTTPAEFRAALPQAIMHGRLSPAWIHLFSTLNIWRERFGLKPRLDDL